MFRSYLSLFGRDGSGQAAIRALVSVSDRFDGASVSQPKQFGSHKSRLIEVLLNDELHRQKAKLSRQQWITLVTWVDINAPYCDTFYNRRPRGGGEPVRNIRVKFSTPFAASANLRGGDSSASQRMKAGQTD